MNREWLSALPPLPLPHEMQQWDRQAVKLGILPEILMENAAAGILKQYLEEGKGSVGTHLDISHDAPTPVGMKVWAEAELTAVDGRKLTFSAVMYDDAGEVGRATHERFIIQNEKFQKKADAKKAAEMEEKLKSNRFTLQDFYDQMVQMKSMGSMEEILAQMPGGGNLKGVKLDEKAMAHTEAIILSMTPKEREKPEIIGASRKKRIAAGAGLKVEDVNRLLKSFEQMRKLIKQFSGPGAGKKMKRMGRMGGFGGFPGF